MALALAAVLVHGGAAAQASRTFGQAELERLLAPIALYPDPLLSQILIAATRPHEVAQAARWSRAHPELAGEEAVHAAGDRDWDPSVKSLLAFPQLLARMDENLEWTRALGEAYGSQEPQVMETVQRLRRRAQAAGNLASDERLRVVEEEGALAIHPAREDYVHVPYYDPRTVYGAWWWAVPPVYWVPWPGYVAYAWRPAWYWGPSVRVFAGFFFGRCDWRSRRVRIGAVSPVFVSRMAIAGQPPAARPLAYHAHERLHREHPARVHSAQAGAASQPGRVIPHRREPHAAAVTHPALQIGRGSEAIRRPVSSDRPEPFAKGEQSHRRARAPDNPGRRAHGWSRF